MCGRDIYKHPFMLIYSPDRYKTPKMCNEAVNDSPGVLKLIGLLQVSIQDSLLANDDILFFNEGFNKVASFC